MILSAPGKLMVSGEYAVLDGAPALVTAVDARLRLEARQASSSSPTLPPEAREAHAAAERALGAAPLSLAVDASALRRRDAKLGLGSSAAAAACAAAAVFAAHGRDPAAHRAEIFACALEGHRVIAPEGSGADVAAASLGGLLCFAKGAPPEPRPWPTDLHTRVVWTGRPARTSDFVRSVRALADSDPAAHARAMGPLGEAAAAFLAAIESADVPGVIRAADAHGRAMGALGDAAGVPILTDALRSVAELAVAHGGSAKPSGAGGGDVALAFFSELAAADAFTLACAAEPNLEPLELALGAEGVRREA